MREAPPDRSSVRLPRSGRPARGWVKKLGRRRIPEDLQREELAALAAIHLEWTGCCFSLRESTRHMRERGFPIKWVTAVASKLNDLDAERSAKMASIEEDTKPCVKCGSVEFGMKRDGSITRRYCLACARVYSERKRAERGATRPARPYTPRGTAKRQKGRRESPEVYQRWIVARRAKRKAERAKKKGLG